MNKSILVILALVLLLATPASAWNELWTQTLTDNYDTGGFTGFYFANPQAFCNNVTRFTGSGIGDYYASNNPSADSGTDSWVFRNPSNTSQYIAFDFTWYSSDDDNWTAAFTYDAVITGYEVTGRTTRTRFTNATFQNTAHAFASTRVDTTYPTDPNAAWMAMGADNYAWGAEYYSYGGSAVTTPVSSFSCTPTSQFPDTDVVCTDLSTNNPTDWLWTIDAEGMGIEGWQTSTSQNFTWQSHYPGLYSVNLRANNSAGSDWENKSSYVSISVNASPNNCNIPPLAGYSRTSFQCTDAMSSGKINGGNIQLHDLEGGAWSNGTNTDGAWCIDTLPAHHINGYGQSTGYTDGSRLNVQEWNGQTYTILMIPGYVPPAATGYVWVYVHVTDWSGSNDIADARVSLSGLGLTTRSDYTDSSGIVHIQWPNATEAYINTGKAGYTTDMTIITTSDFGPDTVNVRLHAGTQTMTIVPTTGPGGTVPTTLGPYGSQTPGPGSTMPSGYTNTQGQAMMDLLAFYGYDLAMLCILVTILAMLGVKLGAK